MSNSNVQVEGLYRFKSYGQKKSRQNQSYPKLYCRVCTFVLIYCVHTLYTHTFEYKTTSKWVLGTPLSAGFNFAKR